MAEEKKQSQYPSEMIDLPSKGKYYPEDSPLREGKLEIKYMTAREEDILTSQNLIKKGIVLDKVLDSLILTKGISSNDLLLGDKNAVMVAARILAYGPEYEAEISNPNTGNKFKYKFNLADCPFVKIDAKVDGNNFEVELPVSKKKITYKVLTGKEERAIIEELKQLEKTGSQISRELTTRLRYSITSVDGDTNQSTINALSNDMLARDSLFLREEMLKMAPDIDLRQKIELEGDTVEVAIPMTVNFFWPGVKT